MSMFLMSEKLLEKELKEKPDILTDEQNFYYSVIEKELHVIQKLNIEMCDMRGEVKEVANRLERSVVLICSPEESQAFERAVQFETDIMN